MFPANDKCIYNMDIMCLYITNTNTDTVGSADPAETGATVGGAVGGLLAVVIVVLVGLFILRRKKRFPSIRKKSDKGNTRSYMMRFCPLQFTSHS